MAEVGDRHADHDPLLIAALLDDDPDASERAMAEARVVACGDCAALHGDLVALSSATRALPTPPRPRDFRLTAADATRLAERGAWEPGASTARLTGVMTGTRDHASHDTLLVAALADRSAAGPERTAAERLVAACSLCARLHADLVAISVATRQLPAPARPRDFTLTPADAQRLRPSGWRRFIAAFGTSRDAFSRPLAAGLTAIGLAGLLFASLPTISGQGATVLSTVGKAVNPQGTERALTTLPSAAASSGNAGAAAPIPAASAAASTAAQSDRGPAGASAATTGGPLVAAGQSLAPVQGPAANASGRFGPAVLPSAEDVYSGSGEGPEAAAASGDAAGGTNDLAGSPEPPSGGASSGPSTMVVVSTVLLVVGLGLFAIRWSARRFGD